MTTSSTSVPAVNIATIFADCQNFFSVGSPGSPNNGSSRSVPAAASCISTDNAPISSNTSLSTSAWVESVSMVIEIQDIILIIDYI